MAYVVQPRVLGVCLVSLFHNSLSYGLRHRISVWLNRRRHPWLYPLRGEPR